jgi:hypothetical protein
MIILKSVKKIKKGNETLYPIAKIVGGKQDGLYLYFNEVDLNLKDLKEDFVKSLELSSEDKRELEKAISENLEPEDEELVPKYYKVIEAIDQQKKKGFVLRSGGKLQPLPNFNRIEKIYISGISGSGKSTFASNFIREYLKQKRKNEFFLFSNVDEDDVLDKLKPIRIDLDDEEALSEVNSSDFYDSLVLFDDTDTISNGLVRKFIQHLRDDLLECGRHYNTTVVAVSHVLQNYQATRKLLNEASSIVFFPRVGSNNHNYKFLKHHCLYDEDTIRRLLNLNSRWVALYRSFPNYVIYEKGVFLI